MVVVTGAYGYTGGYVARRLIDKGVRVKTWMEGRVVAAYGSRTWLC